MPVQLRQLFAIILHTCDLPQPLQLRELHTINLSDNVRSREDLDSGNISNVDSININALFITEDSVLSMSGYPLRTFGLPQPKHQEEHGLGHEIFRERNYNGSELTNDRDQCAKISS